jgi:hypothetical protein
MVELLKECWRCEETKRVGEFVKGKRTCLRCNQELWREWYEKNKERRRIYMREYRRRKKLDNRREETGNRYRRK